MNTIEVNLQFKRSTKGTHLYIDESGATAIGSIYVKKLGLPANPPAFIHVVITEGGIDEKE